MAAKKARKRAYIPPANEVVNRRERTAPSRTQRTSASSARGPRQAYEYPKPSFKRTARRLPIYFLLIFALQFWVVGQEQNGIELGSRVAYASTVAAFITVLFAPFMHVMDKWAYGRYLRRTGQQPKTKDS